MTDTDIEELEAVYGNAFDSADTIERGHALSVATGSSSGERLRFAADAAHVVADAASAVMLAHSACLMNLQADVAGGRLFSDDHNQAINDAGVANAMVNHWTRVHRAADMTACRREARVGKARQ